MRCLRPATARRLSLTIPVLVMKPQHTQYLHTVLSPRPVGHSAMLVPLLLLFLPRQARGVGMKINDIR